jgi:hypothetical protein
VFEVAYTQPTCRVVLEAARRTCLTRGEVQLVVVIDIVHKTDTKRRELKSVTWSHLEEDVQSCREVEDGEQGRWTTFDQKHGGNEEEDDDDVDDEGGSDDENDAMRMKARMKRTRTMKRSVMSGLMTKAAATGGR